MTSIKKEVFRGSAWALALRIGTALSALAINALLARVVTTSDLGVYFLITSLINTIIFAVTVGLPGAAVRVVAETLAVKHYQRTKKAVRLVVWLCAGSTTLNCTLLGLGGIHILNRLLFAVPLLDKVGWLVAILLFLWAMQTTVAELFRGFNDIRLAVTFRRLAPNIFFSCLLLWLALEQQLTTLPTVLMMACLAWGFSLGWAFYLLGKKIQVLPRETAHSTARINATKIISLAWPMGCSLFLTAGLRQADVWIVGSFADMETVALYGAASRLVNFVIFPLLIINASFPPLLSRLHTQGKIKDLEKLMRSAASATTLLGLAVLIGTFFGGKYALVLIFGDSFIAAGRILLILACGLFFRFFCGAGNMALMMSGGEKIVMRISICSAVLMVSGATWAGRIWGGEGVACAVAVSSLLQNAFTIAALRKTIGINPLPYARPSEVMALTKEIFQRS